MDSRTDKVCVVTGGGGGIGRALAHRFRAAGMRMAIADIEVGALDATVAELGGDGDRVLGVPCDVRSVEYVGATPGRDAATLRRRAPRLSQRRRRAGRPDAHHVPRGVELGAGCQPARRHPRRPRLRPAPRRAGRGAHRLHRQRGGRQRHANGRPLRGDKACRRRPCRRVAERARAGRRRGVRALSRSDQYADLRERA